MDESETIISRSSTIPVIWRHDDWNEYDRQLIVDLTFDCALPERRRESPAYEKTVYPSYDIFGGEVSSVECVLRQSKLRSFLKDLMSHAIQTNQCSKVATPHVSHYVAQCSMFNQIPLPIQGLSSFE